LNDSDLDTTKLFLRLIEVVFGSKEQVFTDRQIRQEILRLSDLLQRTNDDKKGLVGLWGELHILRAADHFDEALKCWCSSSNAKYDFAAKNFLLEIKSTLKTTRLHRFSVEQLRPKIQVPLFIASLLLVERPGGESVGTLVDELLEKIDDTDLRAAFLSLCIQKVGANLYHADTKLSLLNNTGAIAVLDALDLPAPATDISDPISNIRFDIDLSKLLEMAPDLSRPLPSFIE